MMLRLCGPNKRPEARRPQAARLGQPAGASLGGVPVDTGIMMCYSTDFQVSTVMLTLGHSGSPWSLCFKIRPAHTPVPRPGPLAIHKPKLQDDARPPHART
jgi:hypothetical protein